MQDVVEAVTNGSMGYYKAAHQFNVPQTILEYHVVKKRNNTNYSVKKVLGSYSCVFNHEQEVELVNYLTKMKSLLFGLILKEVRVIAFQLADRNNIKHPFNRDNSTAGMDWMKGFMARNPILTVRKPEATSAARAMGFNKVSVQKFFDLFIEQVDTHKLTPDVIFNVDETGLTSNPKSHTKVVALKERR